MRRHHCTNNSSGVAVKGINVEKYTEQGLNAEKCFTGVQKNTH